MEVKMLGSLIRKSIISAPLFEKNSGEPVLSEQSIHKKCLILRNQRTQISTKLPTLWTT